METLFRIFNENAYHGKIESSARRTRKSGSTTYILSQLLQKKMYPGVSRQDVNAVYGAEDRINSVDRERL